MVMDRNKKTSHCAGNYASPETMVIRLNSEQIFLNGSNEDSWDIYEGYPGEKDPITNDWGNV